jgi:hypothetical protein
MKQQIIFIEGPSTAWKSTAVGTILNKYDRFFHINKDKIKWLISDYQNRVDWDREMLGVILLSMCEHALNNWLSLIIEWQRELEKSILELSEWKNINVKYINIEAPLELLKQRLIERVEESRKLWIKLWNTSADKLVILYNLYLENKYIQWITLDTSILNKEEVVQKIENHLE